MRGLFRVSIFCIMAITVWVGAADAQYVFLARKALGAVRQMTSQMEGQTYSTAIVLLEADADKVYGAAVNILKESPRFKITTRDAVNRTVTFSDGKESASMKASKVQPDLTQLIVTGTSSQETSTVVDGVMRVCHQLKVNCELTKE